MAQTGLLSQTLLPQAGLFGRKWLTQTGLLERTESQTIILQGKGGTSLKSRM